MYQMSFGGRANPETTRGGIIKRSRLSRCGRGRGNKVGEENVEGERKDGKKKEKKRKSCTPTEVFKIRRLCTDITYIVTVASLAGADCPG